MKKWWFLIFGFLLLSGCTEKEEAPAEKTEPVKEEIKIEDYFPQENKTYTYRGEGNEYSAYTEVFFKRTDSYLPSIVENGGTRILRIYQLTKKGIYLVYEQPEFYDEQIPSFEEMKKQFNPVPLLEKPIKANKTFDDWEIINTNENLSLPTGELRNVIIVEQRDQKNNTIVRKYWAPKTGLVKQEFKTTEENNDEFIVKSELEKIE